MRSEKGGGGATRVLFGKAGNYSVGEGKEGRSGEMGRRVKEMDCPRHCPRPAVCLHQSSAKRADRTEEAGEIGGGRGGGVQAGTKEEGE